MNVLVALLIVFVIVNANEVWWRSSKRHNELSRKLVHISVGSFAAFWPFFMGWSQIRLICLAFLVVVLASRLFNVFQSIHAVERRTYGEAFFALGLGATTYLTSSHWVYAAAILQMSLADGLAGLIGVMYGKKSRYLVLGNYNSLAGTTIFAVTSVLILVFCNHLGGLGISGLQILNLALIATIIENIASHGLDNFLLPVVAAALITRL